MKNALLASALLFLTSHVGFAQERQLRQLIASGSWAAGLQYCDNSLPLDLAMRPDPRGISPELLARLALLCSALATGAHDEGASSWWWYTATNLHADTRAIVASLRDDGVTIGVPPPRKFGGPLPTRSDSSKVRLPSGEFVPGTPPRPLDPQRPPKHISKHTRGVWATKIEVEILVDYEGRPRQPLLVTANGWPLHVFYVYHYLRSWRFEPAVVGGKPVDALFRVSVSTRSGAV